MEVPISSGTILLTFIVFDFNDNTYVLQALISEEKKKYPILCGYLHR